MIVKPENIIFPEGYKIENRIVRYKHKTKNLSFTFNMERDIEFLCCSLKEKFNGDDNFVLFATLKKSVLPIKYRNDCDCQILSQFINCSIRCEDGSIKHSSNFKPYSFLCSDDEENMNVPIEISNYFISITDV